MTWSDKREWCVPAWCDELDEAGIDNHWSIKKEDCIARIQRRISGEWNEGMLTIVILSFSYSCYGILFDGNRGMSVCTTTIHSNESSTENKRYRMKLVAKSSKK